MSSATIATDQRKINPIKQDNVGWLSAEPSSRAAQKLSRKPISYEGITYKPEREIRQREI